MMLLPKWLMLGYLLGALMTSITLGLVIVFSLEGSDAVSTTENTLSPAATMTLGGIALAAAFVLGTCRHRTVVEHSRARKQDKGPPRWQQALGRGSARTTFVVGPLLTLPGASYLSGLSRIDRLKYSTAVSVLLVVVFNLIMLALLEVPLLCFAIGPDWTVGTLDQSKAWIAQHGHQFAVRMLIARTSDERRAQRRTGRRLPQRTSKSGSPDRRRAEAVRWPARRCRSSIIPGALDSSLTRPADCLSHALPRGPALASGTVIGDSDVSVCWSK